MKEKHIILRNAPTNTRDLFSGPVARGLEDASAGPVVELEELDRDGLKRVARHADVVAVAPAIPMKLIAPIETEDTAQPAAGGMAWGVRAVGADTSPFTGEGIVVAVLDTGIDRTHSAFSGVELIEEDFTGSGNGDANGHGTHCAGTIFGRPVSGTRIGVAPGVRRALIGKVLGGSGGSSDQIVSAIQWANENGAHVISMSLGIDFPGFVARLIQQGFPEELATSRALEGYRANLQLFAAMAGLLRSRSAFGQANVVIAAAGNESQRHVHPDFEIAVSPPAVAEGIVSVAALGQSPGGLTVAPFSNTGANIAGPGVGILSAWKGGAMRSISGTSMATPHVAGVAALWAEKLGRTGSLTTLALTARLVASGVSAGLAPGFDPADVGTGLVRAPQS